MITFTKTNTILDKILAHKVAEIGRRSAHVSFSAMRVLAEQSPFPVRSFAAALHQPHVALIAEVKKASPSKGVLAADFDPLQIADAYQRSGASAISVLTDEQFFMGHLDDLRAVRQEVEVPLLRKDFVISPYQVDEARANGADAVLLIVAALGDDLLRDLHDRILSYGMTALVEVHDELEVERALKVGASVIGINNRNLHTFQVSLEVTERLARWIPEGVTLVAESGIHTAEDVERMSAAGAHAVLVGESLVTAGDIGAQVRALSAVRRRRDAR
jgi:indole-3-glycerol phosphate synthase